MKANSTTEQDELATLKEMQAREDENAGDFSVEYSIEKKIEADGANVP